MSKALKLMIGIIVVALVAGALLIMGGKNTSQTKSTSAANNNSSTTSSTNQAASATITYDGDKFSPASVTVKAGDSVKVVNSSETDMQFDSDPHPVHTDNTELNAGLIAPGESKTFTLTNVGKWGYHNHLNSSQQGTIVVE